jgi:hypothetical protein
MRFPALQKIVITLVQEPEEIVRFDTLRERLRETITFEPLPLDDEVEIERLVATDENGEPRRRV